jgi:adenine-specific DNA-methyltransferase
MDLIILKPRKALNKAYLKVKANRADIELFKTNLIGLLDKINEGESEEFHKNLVSKFLTDTWYKATHFINTKGRNDLVIHNSSSASSSVGVIVEAKKPGNKAEMMKLNNLNSKAFQELVLYYLRERITHKNLEIKYLVATNIYEWFIFDAQFFEKEFAQNKELVKQFTDFEEGRLSGKDTDFFYKNIAAPAISDIQHEVMFTHFNIRDYEKPLRNLDKKDDNILIALYKLLSPEHLLKLPFANDSNTLDKTFYTELLHLIGLTETKDGGKKLIERKKEGERNSGSLIESAIFQLDNLDKISRLEKPSAYGENKQQRLFNVALELAITWINRILFLKLLEAQLIKYHKGDKSFAFLNNEKVRNFDDLNNLFFSVLARKPHERNDEVKTLFANVPYLNSSLFEPTELEHACLFISQLKDGVLPLISSTVIKDNNGKKCTGKQPTLDYLFNFLEAYDFASEGSEGIQETNKQLINASVLGLIFEKINGYKDGSFFTPGFITMYMCRENIRRAVVQKFNETKGWNCTDISDLYDKIGDRKEDRIEANAIINSLKICDPAVGSGHFLVSALNEMIAIKSELKVLLDRDGKRLKEYWIEVVNDELVVTDDEAELFEYNPRNKESQRIQETLFHEKQTIIENCLFGVDLNPNSVKICRLRLWIELLKNAYYRVETLHATSLQQTQLETLPNIDINIKCGNSLISRYGLDADIKKALKAKGWTVSSYREAVSTYRNAKSKEEKRSMEELILEIKQQITSEIRRNDPLKTRFDKLAHELYNRFTGNFLFEPESEYNKRVKELEKKGLLEKERIEKEMDLISKKMDEIRNNKLYENPLEWRFEFPEVLNDNGDFVGFDVIIGNPPYFSLSKIKDQASFFKMAGYQTYSKGADIYCLFYERGNQILSSSGILTYITSNSWLRAIYGDLLKKYFTQNMHPICLLNIEDIQVFEEATVESNIITLNKNKNTLPFLVANLSANYDVGSSLSNYFAANSFEFKIPETAEWTIGNEQTGALKLKIERNSKLLKEFNIRINFGIKTGYNAAFIIDEEVKNELINSDPNCVEIIKPILRGRDLKKYSYEFGNCYLINTHNGIKLKNILRVDVEKDYPIIFNHLNKFLPNIEIRYDKGDHWSNLRNCAYLEDFEKPKIVWGEISDKPKFAYDDSNYYAEATTFILTGERLKYLLAVLNSRVSEWYFNQIGTTTGMGTNRWKKYKIELLPIKLPSDEDELKIVNLVNQLLQSKQQNPTANTAALEAEIDQLVYQLYGLTDEEIKIVESS